MRRKKRRLFVSLGSLFLFVLPSALGLTQELRKVRIAIPALSPASTAFFVAKQNGYYRSEGLDVEMIVMPSALAIQAMIGGNVEFATAGGAGVPPALRGAPFRFLFATFDRPMYWLYSKPGIRSLSDLKGRTVGVSSLGSGPDSLLRDLLKKQGLEGGREVAIMAIGSGTARFVALKAGSVDASMLSIPSNFLAREAGFRQLVSFIEEDLVELQGSVLAPERLLESDPSLVEKFLRGTLRGLRTFRENRSGTCSILARSMGITEEFAGQIYDLVRPGTTEDGTVSVAMQRKSLEHVLERAGLKEAPPLERIFNFSLTEKLRDELRAKGWRP